jgi:hypothetical protein
MTMGQNEMTLENCEPETIEPVKKKRGRKPKSYYEAKE